MTLTAAPDTRPAPAEPTTPIKPSDGIRLGCLLYPVQGFGMAAFNEEDRRACALQAMVAGGALRGLIGREHDCPEGDGPWCGRRSSDSTVVHLNDEHRWSRERIADWLEGLGL